MVKKNGEKKIPKELAGLNRTGELICLIFSWNDRHQLLPIASNNNSLASKRKMVMMFGNAAKKSIQIFQHISVLH